MTKLFILIAHPVGYSIGVLDTETGSVHRSEFIRPIANHAQALWFATTANDQLGWTRETIHAAYEKINTTNQ